MLTSLIDYLRRRFPWLLPGQHLGSTATAVRNRIFSMVLAQKPVSANRGPKASFTAALVAESKRRIGGPMLSGPLYARIIWFHKYKTTEGDADNIAKRTLDSLEKVVFANDHAVTHCLAIRIDASGDMAISQRDVDDTVFEEFLELLGEPSVPNILYIEVGEHAGTNVTFGRVN